MLVNIRDTGAVGDGVTRDTEAIQRAVDMCADAGGGRVFVPAGEYLTGRIVLRSNITLEFGEGGTFLAATDMDADYPYLPDGPEDQSIYARFRREGIDMGDTRQHKVAVLYACGARNVTITGHGGINGNYLNILERHPAPDKPRWASYKRAFTETYGRVGTGLFKRPVLVFFQNCENVHIQDVRLFDAPFYTVQCRSCRGVFIHDVTVDNDLRADNSDGFHFSSCCDVHIRDCRLRCGDDCIAVDGNDSRDSSHVTISGCTFQSAVSSVRLFTCLALNRDKRNAVRGTAVRDVVISNCTVIDATTLLSLHADEGTVERVSVSNVSGELSAIGTVFIITSHSAKVRDIRLSGLRFRANGVGYIYSHTDDGIDGVSISDASFDVAPRTKLYGGGVDMPTFEELGIPQYGPMPVYFFDHYMPYFLEIKRAGNVLLRDVAVRWSEGDLSEMPELIARHKEFWYGGKLQPWSVGYDWPAIWISESHDVRGENLRVTGYGDAEAVRVENSTGVNLDV